MVAGVIAVIAAAHDAQGRRHGALMRIAPTNSSWAFRQVGLVNSVAKGTSRATMASGRVSMVGLLVRFGSGQLTLSLYFF